MMNAMAWQDLTPRQPNLTKASARRGPIRGRTPAWARRMIDIFTVVLPHVLMAIAVWHLLHRDDLDQDPSMPGFRGILKRRKPGAPKPGEGTPGA